jgi:tRNA pseudouridine55 synthase
MADTARDDVLQGIIGKSHASNPQKSPLTSLAINKPINLTSADVLRVLQRTFKPSPLFAPYFAAVRAASEQQRGPQQRRGHRARRALAEVKLGHGGTLDPLATGVLIVGVGAGTKGLPRYLTGSRKTYEAVLCLGAATDSFDVRGRVTGRDGEGAARVTREGVEGALGRFRGGIRQRPPAFSARRVNGERLYDIARREGGEVPQEMVREREVEVFGLEALEFWERGERQWEIVPDDRTDDAGSKRKRKRGGEGKTTVQLPEKVRRTAEAADKAEAGLEAKGPYMSGALPIPDREKGASEGGDAPSTAVEGGAEPTAGKADAESLLLRGPAVRLRMTVSSGFYVRSLCHDLAKELGTLGVMAELVRTTQAEFELGKNVLEYDDLERGEDVWGPRLRELLQDPQQSSSSGPSPSLS